MDIKNVLTKVLAFLERIQEAMSDDSPGGKKITLVEIPGLVMSFIALIPIFGKLKELASSIKDMTDAEREDLKVSFANDFDITNDQSEAKIEAGFNWILDTYKAASILFSVPKSPGTGGNDDEN